MVMYNKDDINFGVSVFVKDFLLNGLMYKMWQINIRNTNINKTLEIIIILVYIRILVKHTVMFPTLRSQFL